MGHYARAMRVHQWTKNLLVFVAPVMAHRLLEWETMAQAGLAFLSFSLCASSGYLFNDILDKGADREHPLKRHRPIASGALSASRAAGMIPFLLVAALVPAVLLSLKFLVVLVLYLVFTLAYSWRLKREAIIDVLVLAGLYTLRIIGGGEATSTPLSFWLLAFSMFLFLSLALVKRYAELSRLVVSGEEYMTRRGYQATDLETLGQFGTASGFLAVLVLALYINSGTILSLYSRPEVIWLLCPLLLYMISRVWLVARRGNLIEDPLVFLLGDRRSQGLILLGGLLFWLAT
jgi:4-hydroxybenzoate polyprenyltransferase